MSTSHTLRPLLIGLLLVGLAGCDAFGGGSPSLGDVLTSVQVGTTQADLVDDDVPTDGTGSAPGIDGGSQIVRGGSAIFGLTPNGADRIYVGVEGEGGRYEAPIPGAGATTLVVTTNGEDTATSYVLLIATETDGAVSAVVRRTLTVNAEANASGQIQVSLNWNAPVDLDLHLETPDGEDIYYGNGTGETGGTLDLDSYAACRPDEVRNENIAWPEGTTPSSGRYVVRVNYWSACDVGAPVPFVVTVTVRGSTRTFQGTFQPGEADGGGAYDGREIHSFTF